MKPQPSAPERRNTVWEIIWTGLVCAVVLHICVVLNHLLLWPLRVDGLLSQDGRLLSRTMLAIEYVCMLWVWRRMLTELRTGALP